MVAFLHFYTMLHDMIGGYLMMYTGFNQYGFPTPYGGQNVQPMQMQQAPQSMGMGYQPQAQGLPSITSQTPQQAGPDWVQVPDIKQVEQIPVRPGGKAWIMVQNQPVFALRVADQTGLATTDYYRFEKIDPEALRAPASSPEYVTRDEFLRFVESLRAPIVEAQAPAAKAATVEKEATV